MLPDLRFLKVGPATSMMGPGENNEEAYRVALFENTTTRYVDVREVATRINNELARLRAPLLANPKYRMRGASFLHERIPISLVDGRNVFLRTGFGPPGPVAITQTAEALKPADAGANRLLEGSAVVVVWTLEEWNLRIAHSPYPEESLGELLDWLCPLQFPPATALPIYFVLLHMDESRKAITPGGSGRRPDRCQFRTLDRQQLVPDEANHLACEYDDVWLSTMAAQFVSLGHAVHLVSEDKNLVKTWQDGENVAEWMEEAALPMPIEIKKVPSAPWREGWEDAWKRQGIPSCGL